MELRFGRTLSVMILTYAILLSALLLLRALELLNLLTFGIWLAIALKSTRRMEKKVKDRPIDSADLSIFCLPSLP